MANNDKISIELEDNEWGQIIDGLTCRAEDYERTAQYHKTGYADDYILEVNNAYEASSLARWYRELIGKIREQVAVAHVTHERCCYDAVPARPCLDKNGEEDEA